MNWEALVWELALLANLTEGPALEWERIEICLPCGLTLVILKSTPMGGCRRPALLDRTQVHA
jgi:hypothetical protein